MKEDLKRIADALEKIAGFLEKKQNESTRPPAAAGGAKRAPAAKAPAPDQGSINVLIAAYIRAWQRRYDTKERPDILKCIGVFRDLLRERTSTELVDLVQVYCQMEDPWFNTKRHDIVTFRENVGKVALAREKGTEQGINWNRVFDNKGGTSDTGALQRADGQALQKLQREELRPGAAAHLLPGVPERS